MNKNLFDKQTFQNQMINKDMVTFTPEMKEYEINTLET